MKCIAIAVGCCLFSQNVAPPDNFEAIPLKTGQGAPPAGMDDLEQAPGTPADQPAPVPADATPGGVLEDPPAADGLPDPPERYKSAPQEPLGQLEALPDRPRQRLRPPELIAEALENPRQSALAGQPLPLSQAIARAGSRPQQLGIAQSYWRLAAAQAEYHWAVGQRELVVGTTEAQPGLAAALGARAAAEADVRDAQLGVEQAQLEMAALLGLDGRANPPLTIDRPHVGEYRTRYESLFGARLPPPRIRLIHQTLPVRRKAIDARADAIVAAIDAVDTASEEFRATGRGFATLLATIELLKHQRTAFIANVRDYNLEIAEYAFAVAPAGAGGDTLVSMLIRTSPTEGNAPTRAPDGNGDPSIRKTFRGRQPDHSALGEDPDKWTSNYPDDVSAGGQDDPGVYQALLGVERQPLRVQKLGNLLHWDRNLPADSSTPVALADCLRGVPAPNRLVVIHAYWHARQSAARFQVLNEQQEQLNALQSIAIPRRDQPGMAAAAVRLQAARRGAKAAILDAQTALLAAQFELTLTAGRPLAEPWLLPSTPPQSGRYVVSKRAASRAPRGARWAEMTSLEYDKLRHRADSVIQSDAARAELIVLARQDESDPPAAGDHLTSLDRVIWATRRQNQQTLAFLNDLTDYNMAIANYALSTLPAALSSEELAGKLAIARSTLRDS